jgi:hypothetical protein
MAGAVSGRRTRITVTITIFHLLIANAPQHFVRFWTSADKVGFWPGNRLSAYDPQATLAVHCGNGFDAGFSPYQSTRLSR